MLSTAGQAVSAKSMATTPPTEEAVWSMRPQGFPKKTFSAYCPICAISIADTALSANSPFRMRPMRTSNAAELERPEPGSTVDFTFASKPASL